MHDSTLPKSTITLTRARLDQLHGDVLRYYYLRALAEAGVQGPGGTRRWWLPPEALPEPATTFDEAVDRARAHVCLCCQAEGGSGL